MQITSPNRGRLLKIYLLLLLLSGLISCALIFLEPSEHGSAILGGYSPSRLSMGFLLITGLVLLGWFAYRVMRYPAVTARFIARIDPFVVHNHHLAHLILGLVLLALLLLGWMFYVPSAYASHLVLLQGVDHRTKPVQVWLLGTICLTILFLLLAYQEIWRKGGYLRSRVFVNILLVYSLIYAALFQWYILGLRLPLFHQLPGWFWEFNHKDLPRNSIWYLVALLIAAAAIILVLKNTNRPRLCLFSLFLVGSALQVAFGFVRGNPQVVFRDKLLHRGHRAYANFAIQENTLHDALYNYDAAFAGNIYTVTKPPGLLVLYTAMARVADRLQPGSSPDEKLVTLATFVAYLFPFISFLVLFPIYATYRRFVEAKEAILPCLIYLCVPGILLVPFEPDAAWFPLIFMLGIYLLVLASIKKSAFFAFVAGIYLYLAVYVTFAFITLAVIFVFFPLVDWLIKRRWQGFQVVARQWLFMGAGLLGMGILFWAIFSYDPFSRYTAAIAAHREILSYQPGLRQMLDALLLNSVDFADWLGFALYLLFIYGSIRSAVNGARDRPRPIDGLLISFAGAVLLLNLGGQTRGEVGRLWLFLVPMITLVAHEEIKALFERKRAGLVLILLLQLITVYVVHNFQDYGA